MHFTLRIIWTVWFQYFGVSELNNDMIITFEIKYGYTNLWNKLWFLCFTINGILFVSQSATNWLHSSSQIFPMRFRFQTSTVGQALLNYFKLCLICNAVSSVSLNFLPKLIFVFRFSLNLIKGNVLLQNNKHFILKYHYSENGRSNWLQCI